MVKECGIYVCLFTKFLADNFLLGNNDKRKTHDGLETTNKPDLSCYPTVKAINITMNPTEKKGESFSLQRE